MAINRELVEQGAQRNFHFEVVQIMDKKQMYNVMGRVMPFHNQLELAKGRTLEELNENIQIGGEAVFAVSDDPEPKDVGVLVGRLKPVRLSGIDYKVYMRYLRVVKPEYQQQDIGTEFTNDAVQRLCPDGFIGRTPNPEIPRAGELSRYIGTIHPIHKLHNYLTIALLAAALDDRYKENLDFKTGRCHGVYPKGAFRLFNLDNASPEVREIYRIMTSAPISTDLENGDGIIYYEEVRKRLCHLPPEAA